MGSGASVDLSPDGSHWIAAGDVGVIIDGEWLRDSDGRWLDVAAPGSGTGVAINDRGEWIAAGNPGVVRGRP
ncbi:MAG: hypothetical protein AB1758_29625 [Candidatus Eremiobacterota bacterium]